MGVPCWTKTAAWLPDTDFEPGGQVFSRGEWLTIIRVNKSNGTVSSVTTPNYTVFSGTVAVEVTPIAYGLQSTIGRRGCAVASQAAGVRLLSTIREGFREMTKAGDGPALPGTVRPCAVWQSRRPRGISLPPPTMDNNFRTVNVYITDMVRKSHRNRYILPGKSRDDEYDARSQLENVSG